MTGRARGAMRHPVGGLVAALVASVLVTVLGIHASTRLSPIDETTHFDYADKVSHGQLVREGDTIGVTTMHELACRGIDYPTTLPPCGSTDPSQFPDAGWNTGAATPPVYYAVDGLAGRALVAAHVVGSPLTAFRLANLLWLVPGVVLTWLVLGLFAVGPLLRAATCTVIGTSAVVLSSEAKVTSDAPSLAVGAGLLLTAVLWERGRLPAWPLIAVAALGAAIKETNLVPVGLVGLYLLVRALPARDPSEPRARHTWREHVAVTAGAAGAAVLVTVAWLEVSRHIAIRPASEDPLNLFLHKDSLPLDAVLVDATHLITPVANPYVIPPLGNHQAAFVLVTVLNWLLLAVLGAAVLRGRRWSMLETLSLSTVAILLLAPAVLTVWSFVLSHVYSPTPGRYAIGALPAFAVMVGTQARKTYATAAVAVLAAAATLYEAATLAAG